MFIHEANVCAWIPHAVFTKRFKYVLTKLSGMWLKLKSPQLKYYGNIYFLYVWIYTKTWVYCKYNKTVI